MQTLAVLQYLVSGIFDDKMKYVTYAWHQRKLVLLQGSS